MPIQIALHGKMRSGKSSLATALAQRLGLPTDAFALPLKLAHQALGLGDGETVKDRAWLQEASGFLTARDDGHFVRLFAQRRQAQQGGVIVTDLRRPIEYAWLKAHGYLLVKLAVSPQTQIERGAEPDRLDHPTETALDVLPPVAWDLAIPEGTPLPEAVGAVLELAQWDNPDLELTEAEEAAAQTLWERKEQEKTPCWTTN